VETDLVIAETISKVPKSIQRKCEW